MAHVTIYGCFGVIWLQSTNWTVAKRVLGSEVGDALRVNAVTVGYPPRVRCFGVLPISWTDEDQLFTSEEYFYACR